jgi:hypothetical protein
MRSLPAPSFKVLLAFARHANVAGIAYPGLDRISALAGMGRRNAERAVNDLERRGFLRTVRAGGGRGHAAIRQVCNPEETPAQCAALSSGETPAQDGTKPRRNATRNPGAGRHKTPAQCAAPTERRTEKTATEGAAALAAPAPEAADSPATLLERAGLDRQTADRLAGEYPAGRIHSVIADAKSRPDLRNVPGFIRAALQNGYEPTPTSAPRRPGDEPKPIVLAAADWPDEKIIAAAERLAESHPEDRTAWGWRLRAPATLRRSAEFAAAVMAEGGDQ